MLILFLDANFRLYCVQKQSRFSMNFICRLVFPNVAQRKIQFPMNFGCRLDFPNGLIQSTYCNLTSYKMLMSFFFFFLFQSAFVNAFFSSPDLDIFSQVISITVTKFYL